MTREQKEEFGKLLESAIEGSLATNDSELYEDAQNDIARLCELFELIETDQIYYKDISSIIFIQEPVRSLQRNHLTPFLFTAIV